MVEPFPLPTDTRAVNIESRQYNLFTLDLGDGLPRVAAKVAPLFYLPWWVLLAVLGVPVLGPTLMIWLLPPTLATTRALTRDDGDRLRLVGWVDFLLWLPRRHRPIVNADRAAPAPAVIHADLAFTVLTLTRPARQEVTGAQALAAA